MAKALPPRRRCSVRPFTVHPSSILRAPDDESRRAEMQLFVRDLQRIADELREQK